MYKTEYQIGKEALQLIEMKLGFILDENEAASIALHLVNAQKEGHLLEHTMKMVRMVQDILNIVRIHYGIIFDEDCISYNRFVTHLQYFAKRVVDNMQQGTSDSFLLEQVKLSYPDALSCAEKIRHYVETTYDYPVGREEIVYLTIHIHRLTQ
ncbi:PRD domain-containing protein [Alkalibacterium olivapovliticus]|uniref:PRD domain-containing protein n=1 Tax=Alkalibacterium olivapovliticus TaxID=99907 RepID=A0A2T0VWW8_9LACT|nr:PRD domain-containing protein [Alkalibacterium olivapovliticus]